MAFNPAEAVSGPKGGSAPRGGSAPASPARPPAPGRVPRPKNGTLCAAAEGKGHDSGVRLHKAGEGEF